MGHSTAQARGGLPEAGAKQRHVSLSVPDSGLGGKTWEGGGGRGRLPGRVCLANATCETEALLRPLAV